MNLVLRGSAVESCTPTFVCVSWGRANNRPWVGRPYLRRRPIRPITGWESSGEFYFLGIKSPLDPASLPRYWRA
jgi:hypothetical protein